MRLMISENEKGAYHLLRFVLTTRSCGSRASLIRINRDRTDQSDAMEFTQWYNGLADRMYYAKAQKFRILVTRVGPLGIIWRGA